MLTSNLRHHKAEGKAINTSILNRLFVSLMLALTLVGTSAFTAVTPQNVAAQEECDVNTDPLCAEDEDLNTVNEIRLDLGTEPGEDGCPTLEEVRIAVNEDDIQHISGCLFGKTSFGDPFVITLDEDYLFTLDHGSENLLVPGNGLKAKTENVSIWGMMAFADVCTWKSHEEFYASEHDIEIVPFNEEDFASCEEAVDEDDDDPVDIDTTA